MRVRPAGSMMTFAEAMERCVEMPATEAALLDYVRAHYNYLGNLGKPRLEVEQYSYDGRPEWDAPLFLVSVNGTALLYTDARPLASASPLSLAASPSRGLGE